MKRLIIYSIIFLSINSLVRANSEKIRAKTKDFDLICKKTYLEDDSIESETIHEAYICYKVKK